MARKLGSALVGSAVFEPWSDGRTEHPIESDTDELCVVMTDGQQHRYVRTERVQPRMAGWPWCSIGQVATTVQSSEHGHIVSLIRWVRSGGRCTLYINEGNVSPYTRSGRKA